MSEMSEIQARPCRPLIGYEESLRRWPRLPFHKRYLQRRIPKERFLDAMVSEHCLPNDVIKLEIAPARYFDDTYNRDWVRGRVAQKAVASFQSAYESTKDFLLAPPLALWQRTQIL